MLHHPVSQKNFTILKPFFFLEDSVAETKGCFNEIFQQQKKSKIKYIYFTKQHVIIINLKASQ